MVDLETVIVVEHIAALTPGMAVTQADLILEEILAKEPLEILAEQPLEILAEQPLEILAEQPRAQQVAGILEEQHLEEIAAGGLVGAAGGAPGGVVLRQAKGEET